MELIVETSGNVAVVTVNMEELDASNADDFKRQIAPILPNNPRLVLDLTRLRFVDSSGCGAILSCLKTLSGLGGDLRLCCVSERVRRTFELIRLHRICEIYPTRQEAVAAFNR
jgi:anti-sigma B factor antagonist